MCNIFDIPKEWAEKSATSEGEAFEKAIKRFKPEDTIQRLTAENADLRRQLREQAEQIKNLRECIRRGSEEEWD